MPRDKKRVVYGPRYIVEWLTQLRIWANATDVLDPDRTRELQVDVLWPRLQVLNQLIDKVHGEADALLAILMELEDIDG